MYYIERICLDNIRGLSQFVLNTSLRTPEKAQTKRSALRATVVVGKNGTCKTTLLRCIAIGLADLDDANALLVEDIGPLVSKGAKNATIELILQSSMNPQEKFHLRTSLTSKKDKDILVDKSHPWGPEDLFVCGYGIGRSHEGKEPKDRSYRIVDSVGSLFRYEQGLMRAELTLRRLKEFLGAKYYENTINKLKNTLGLRPRDRIEIAKGGGIFVSGQGIGKRIPLAAWADGYRMTFLWLLDMYAWGLRARVIKKTGYVRGILLVDELEQHCHPSMQITLLERLHEAIPGMQIIASTHSPMVALGAIPSQVIVMRREGDSVFAETDLPDFSKYSIEDMIADPKLFDSDVYCPEISNKLHKFRKLASIPRQKRTAREKRDFKLITAELLAFEILSEAGDPFEHRLGDLVRQYDL